MRHSLERVTGKRTLDVQVLDLAARQSPHEPEVDRLVPGNIEGHRDATGNLDHAGSNGAATWPLHLAHDRVPGNDNSMHRMLAVITPVARGARPRSEPANAGRQKIPTRAKPAHFLARMPVI